MAKKVDYEEVFEFMSEFGVAIMTHKKELILDEKNNVFATVEGCSDMWEVKTRVTSAVCRPIGKGLSVRDANRLLEKFNKYFKSKLTREDMLLIYQKLDYERTMNEFKGFVKRGFPMNELKETENGGDKLCSGH